MQFDFPLAELETYRPEVQEPEDFDDFWTEQLRLVAKYPLDATFDPVPGPLHTVDVLDVSFNGHGGDRIRGWMLLPLHRAKPMPTIVEFVGYGGGRGLSHESLLWSAAGYAHLIMDTRGQGSTWSVGDSPDPGDTGDPSFPGFMSKGIRTPATYYYVRLFVDAFRALQAARSHPFVDRDRIAVTGQSQGGGVAIAATHLAGIPVAAMVDVPFLANFARAVEITDSDPYAELAVYCHTHRDQVEAVFRTLSYVDVVNHAKRANAAALFSVGLTDMVAPPSTVFAAYNWWGGDKQIEVYPFNGHEGGGAHHDVRKVEFAHQRVRDHVVE